ncbi:MAG: hypothetical protein A3G81_01540 [Betaproteobacteria bacterium RIFCSPLOWO2_12_FULL_65_14]|nr:MAG: hypothetical protein A3G81_01540 [Betaproteobacteria bacterium RIFCSPLOWO2_12_FULL_65_14]
MSDAKHSCIAAYLAEHFPGAKIDQKRDFDLRAQSFKLQLSDDNLLLKVSEEFIRENDEPRIAALLKRWEIATLLKANSHQTVLITTDGPQAMPRP